MNTAMIEQAIVQELHDMPPEAAQEVLDFARFIKQRRKSASDSPPPRPKQRVGLLAGEGVELKDVGIPKKRKAGALKGQIKLSDDFNAPLDDFAEYQ